MNLEGITTTATSGDRQSGHRPSWHVVLMLLCCVIPVAALLAVTVFGMPTDSLLSLAVLLLCLAMMLLMMRSHAH